MAIHVIHVLPPSAPGELAQQLLDIAENNAADVLHRFHRALELDGRSHDYAAVDWLPIVHDTAAPLLESTRLDVEPPSLVQYAQEAVSWLSSAIINLDHDAPGTPEAAAADSDITNHMKARGPRRRPRTTLISAGLSIGPAEVKRPYLTSARYAP